MNEENQENQNDQVWTRVLEWEPRPILTPPKVWIKLEIWYREWWQVTGEKKT